MWPYSLGLCLKVAVSRLSAKCQDPLEHHIDVVARSPTPVETDASHALSPAAEEETDHPSTPVTPYDPVKMYGFLLQHLTSAIEKVGSLNFCFATISIRSCQQLMSLMVCYHRPSILQVRIYFIWYGCVYVCLENFECTKLQIGG